MVIKCGAGIATQVKGCIFFIFYFAYEFIKDADNPIEWIVPSLLSSMLFIMLIMKMIRTICITKDGCLISLWRFDKFYRWDELETRKVQRLGWHHTSEPYSKAVYFCNKRIHKFSWLKPNKYLLRPMSFFYVHFLPERPLTKIENKFPLDYAVDEKEFMAKMAEWGIELEEEKRTAFI